MEDELEQEDEDSRFEGLSSDVKKLLRYRHKTVEELEEFWTKYCEYCNKVKPARTHHCKVCNRCTFVMDHHCPWINNCVGLENYRYFLLFILYLTIGLGYMLVTIRAMHHHYLFKQHRKLMTFLSILDGVCFIVMSLFTCWNWFQALFGSTTIEFLK